LKCSVQDLTWVFQRWGTCPWVARGRQLQAFHMGSAHQGIKSTRPSKQEQSTLGTPCAITRLHSMSLLNDFTLFTLGVRY
jgi:hypothetical protein